MVLRIGQSVALTADAYRSVADVLGIADGIAPALVEGFLQAQTFGLTVRFGDEAQPATAAEGLQLAAGAALGVGPAKSAAAAWPLNRIWVRNTTAGSNATVAVVGIAE